MDSVAKVIISKIAEIIDFFVGTCLVIFNGIPTIYNIININTVKPGSFIFNLCLLALGVLLLILGARRAFLVKKYKRYVSFLSNGSGLLDELASELGKDQSSVEKDLNKMCKKNYFPNGQLDPESGRFICNTRNFASYTEGEFTVATCKSCGGSTKVKKGDVGKCDYCGSPIKGEW